MRVVDMSQGKSQRLGGDRTLLSSSDPVERLKFIRSKQWIQGAPAYSPHLHLTADKRVSAAAHRMMANMQYVPARAWELQVRAQWSRWGVPGTKAQHIWPGLLRREECAPPRRTSRGAGTEERGRGGVVVVAVTVAVTVATEEEEKPEEAKTSGTSPSFSAAASPFP